MAAAGDPDAKRKPLPAIPSVSGSVYSIPRFHRSKLEMLNATYRLPQVTGDNEQQALTTGRLPCSLKLWFGGRNEKTDVRHGDRQTGVASVGTILGGATWASGYARSCRMARMTRAGNRQVARSRAGGRDAGQHHYRGDRPLTR